LGLGGGRKKGRGQKKNTGGNVATGASHWGSKTEGAKRMLGIALFGEQSSKRVAREGHGLYSIGWADIEARAAQK